MSEVKSLFGGPPDNGMNRAPVIISIYLRDQAIYLHEILPIFFFYTSNSWMNVKNSTQVTSKYLNRYFVSIYDSNLFLESIHDWL